MFCDSNVFAAWWQSTEEMQADASKHTVFFLKYIGEVFVGCFVFDNMPVLFL